MYNRLWNRWSTTQLYIQGAVVLNHHWEQFHHDCAGAECVHCIRHPATTLTSDIGKKGHFRRGSADTDVIIQPQVTTDRDMCEKVYPLPSSKSPIPLSNAQQIHCVLQIED